MNFDYDLLIGKMLGKISIIIIIQSVLSSGRFCHERSDESLTRGARYYLYHSVTDLDRSSIGTGAEFRRWPVRSGGRSLQLSRSAAAIEKDDDR
jgi:hypothetical protein